MASLMNKARKPKFELHLCVYDLNNVPLVAGTSLVKWHLPASIHGENRGRTAKCSIDKINHRVTYNYSKIIPLRISIDRNNNLTECPAEFEVVQEFPMVPGGRDEKITLGTVKLNLSEYVEESENFPRRSTSGRDGLSLDHARDRVVGQNSSHRRLNSTKSINKSNVELSPTSTAAPPAHLEENDVVDEEAEEGIVRRYLMQDSKVNSTLKLGILMVQIDGERNYVAPPLKTAPMFGGIAGINMTGEQQQQPVDTMASDDAGDSTSLPTSLNKSRDTSELQDMYRRALAASWACQPGELPADECIEDIFSGGSGWHDKTGRGGGGGIRRNKSRRSHTGRSPESNSPSTSASASGSASGDETAGGMLRPSSMRRMAGHLRSRSGSDKSRLTVTGGRHTYGGNNGEGGSHNVNGRSSSSHSQSNHRRNGSASSNIRFGSGREERNIGILQNDSGHEGIRSRSESLVSMASTLGSERSERDRGREGFIRPMEVDEYDVRDDLVAWKLPETVT